MFGKKNCADLSKINSCIGAGNVIDGEFRFSGTLKFGGTLNGSLTGIKPDGKVDSYTVAIIEGRVAGEKIEADHVIVIGQVEVKTLIARRTLIINKTADIHADQINYLEIATEQGAKISGQLSRISTEAEAK